MSCFKFCTTPVCKGLFSLKHSSFHRPNFINTVIMGGYEMDTWFWSPYPNECVTSGTIYICEKCLELKRSKDTLQSHNVIYFTRIHFEIFIHFFKLNKFEPVSLPVFCCASQSKFLGCSRSIKTKCCCLQSFRAFRCVVMLFIRLVMRYFAKPTSLCSKFAFLFICLFNVFKIEISTLFFTVCVVWSFKLS